MAVHAGTQIFVDRESDDTMAAAIEREFNRLMLDEFPGHDPLPPENTPESRQRRMLFAAIARGVIGHLAAHPESFGIVFTAVPPNHKRSDFAAHITVDATIEPL